MCTVTIIPTFASGGGRAGVRLACNRDELRSRPIATKVVEGRFSLRRAIMPVDPVSSGTWIAASDAGLVMCLLNVYAKASKQRSRLQHLHQQSSTSRGMIIPQLLGAESLTHAISLACQVPIAEFQPFRLVLVDCHEVAELKVDADQLLIARRWQLRTPVLFTSSGLGDDVVQTPRRKLFESMFDLDNAWECTQDEFHHHRWPDRSHLSVNMSRPDACTVSFTTVELDSRSLRLTYAPACAGDQASTIERALTLQKAIAA